MKKSEVDYAKIKKKNQKWYKALFPLAKMIIGINYKMDDATGTLPEGANLILANHVTAMDPFLIAFYFGKRHIYFVAGENVVSNFFMKKLIFGTIGVIVHMRGVSSINTIKEMTRHLKRGDNVEIFPEGSTTFDGRTKAVDASIAKVAKVSNCNLVLTRIEGGYFTSPRWGKSSRKGLIRLSHQVISKEQLSLMTPQEIMDNINSYLYTDAYEEQKATPVKFKSKNRCKGLESCIYECPSCNKISGLKTTGTKLFCKCGFEAEYDEYGYLNSNSGMRYTISELCESQREHLKQSLEKGISAEPLFEDDFEVKKLYTNGDRELKGNVKISVYSDRIEYSMDNTKGKIDNSLVKSVFIFRRNKMTCLIKDKNYGYELQGDFSSNALKYRDLFELYEAN